MSHIDPALKPLRTISLGMLLDYNFPRREYLLEPWLRQGESAMIWAQTGLGKTMATLTMALAVAGGGSVLNWTNHTPRKVLVVDGEMFTEDLKDRLKLLAPTVDGIDLAAAGKNLTLLSRQFQRDDVKFPDLASEAGQDTVRALIRQLEAELVIVDNFSTCCEVVDENEAAAMSPVLSFLLTLKQMGVACILVHHSGKTGGTYRGSSKLATTFEAILGLKPWEGARAGAGTAFETEWTKFRGAPHAGVTAALVRLEEQPEGGVKWVAEASEADDAKVLVGTVLRCEFSTGKAIAAFLQWDESKVTRTKAKAIRSGLLTDEEWKRCLQDAEGAVAGASDGF